MTFRRRVLKARVMEVVNVIIPFTLLATNPSWQRVRFWGLVVGGHREVVCTYVSSHCPLSAW
jgi:hypothetical protein